MLISESIKSDYSYPCSAEELKVNSCIRSVTLDLCTRYGAVGILGIGLGSLPLCIDLHSAGYAVAIMNPDTNSMTDPDRPEPADRFHLLTVKSSHDQVKIENFNTAIIIEPGQPFLNFSTLIESAASRLQFGSIVILSIPYHGYLKSLMLTANQWWNFFCSIARFSKPVPCWSRANLTVLLESNGFSVIERIGVRNSSLQWQTQIIVARKLYCKTRYYRRIRQST